MTNAELIEIMKNDDPNAQVDFKILYGNGELKPVIHARWIPRYNEGDFPRKECSNCHKWFLASKVDDSNYCPNCGANMREVEE